MKKKDKQNSCCACVFPFSATVLRTSDHYDNSQELAFSEKIVKSAYIVSKYGMSQKKDKLQV